MKTNKKGVSAVIIISIVLLVAVATTVVVLLFNGNDKNNNGSLNNVNNTINDNIDKEESNKSNSDIKKIDYQSDKYYILKDNGVLYWIETFQPFKIKEVTSNVKEFWLSDDGLVIKTLDDKSYILNGYWQTDNTNYQPIEEKILNTSLGIATIIEVDNVKSVVSYNLMYNSENERPILILGENGGIYKYIINQSTNEHKFEKIMNNIKEMVGTSENTLITTKDNISYIFGNNMYENGVFGKSDSKRFSEYKLISYSNRYEVGKNLNKLKLYTVGSLTEIYNIDTNNNLYMMGQGSSGQYIMGEQGKKIEEFTLLATDVEEVYPSQQNVYIKKTDGSLWMSKLHTYRYNGFEKILDGGVNEVYTDGSHSTGIFILMNNNDLYVYGENNLDMFGQKNDIKEFKTPTKIMENVENVYCGIGIHKFITTKEGKCYYSGHGINDEDTTWTEIEIKE